MIRSIHWRGCIVIAADKRSMVCDLETGTLKLHTDQEQKNPAGLDTAGFFI